MVDLRPDQLATVLAILQAKVPECEVWAFGSRAKWTAKDSSDLDLALVTPERIPLSKLGRLREAFKDSYLPINVDVVDIHRVSDEFRTIIESQRVALQKPNAAATGQTDRAKWQTLPLEACLETIIDYRGKTPKKVSSGIPLITAKVVKNGRIEAPDEFIAEEDYEGWMRRGIPRAGDVLLTMEAPLGEVAQLDDRKVALAQRLVALRGKRGLLDNWYLKYLLQSTLVQDQLKSRASGTTVLGIKQSELRKINLTLPPLDEQRAMAQVLGSLDDKIELNRRMNETLEAMTQGLFQKWFVDSTRDGLPKGWRELPLPQAIEVNPLRPLRNGEVAPYLDMANMPTRAARAMEVYDREFGSGMRFKDGDTLVARITPCLENGKTCFVDFLGDGKIGWGSTEYIVLHPKPPLPPEFAYFLARTENFRTFAISNMTGTSGRQRVPADCLNNFTVTLPPAEVAERFGQFARAVFARMKDHDEQSRTLAALRDSLLPKLLSGELRVSFAKGQT
jgi:type I restriction enzyme, S subunit